MDLVYSQKSYAYPLPYEWHYADDSFRHHTIHIGRHFDSDNIRYPYRQVAIREN